MNAPTPAADPLLAVRERLLAGDGAGATTLLRAHLAGSPADARAWGLLARCLREAGDRGAAHQAVQRALALQPQFPAVWFELALLHRDAGDSERAAAVLEHCIQHDPGHTAARWEYATLQASRAPQPALAALQPLLQAPQVPLAARCLQLSLLDTLGRHTEARALLDDLLRAHADAPALLEIDYRWCCRDAVAPARRAVAAGRLAAAAPTPVRLLDWGRELQELGDFAAARRAARDAAALDPAFLPARWAAYFWPAGPAPVDDAAVDDYRRSWEAGLAAFEGEAIADPTQMAMVWGCVGQCTAFYRHYLGDELADPGRYGRLIHRMMALLDPGEAPRPLREGRRRIGVCSAFLREHTVARLFVPLLEALDPARFELVVFSLADAGDRWSARLRARAASCHSTAADAAGWRTRIAAAELDVLVYPEVGMHPIVQALAALRLAPLQLALWGHPVSTGLPSIDLFLSADALEPDDAQARYTETLLRLPGLGHGLREEDLPTPRAPDLWQPDPQRIDLLCAQTVFKLLPRQDRLFARILAALPEARLHLLADHRPAVCDWLRARMAPTLAAAGADPDKQLHIHGFVDHARYLGLAGVCRLNLDTVGWSGGMSALDLLAQGLPTLCLPGESMRSRQTAALLQRLALPELIAQDEDDYVAKAITLARDPARCAALSATLRERRGRLFAEPATAAALNTLLAGVQRLPDGSLRLP